MKYMYNNIEIIIGMSYMLRNIIYLQNHTIMNKIITMHFNMNLALFMNRESLSNGDVNERNILKFYTSEALIG